MNEDKSRDLKSRTREFVPASCSAVLIFAEDDGGPTAYDRMLASQFGRRCWHKDGSSKAAFNLGGSSSQNDASRFVRKIKTVSL